MSLHPDFIKHWEQLGYAIKKKDSYGDKLGDTRITLYYACKDRAQIYIGVSGYNYALYSFGTGLYGMEEERMLRVLALKAFL